MNDFRWQETSLALRRLRHRPATTLASVLTLAAAFAAALATWILIDGVLLTPLPVQHPDQLFVVGARYQDRNGVPGPPSSTHLFPVLDKMRSTGAFARVTATGRMGFLVGDPNRKVSREVMFIDHDYFDVLGVKLAIGPGFRAEDDRAGAPLVTILSDRYWRSERNADRNVIGQQITIADQTATIVGVAPPGFRGLSLTDGAMLFVPAQTVYDIAGRAMDYLAMGLKGTSPMSWFTIVGRLESGRTGEQAAAILKALPVDRGRTYDITPINTAAIPVAAQPNMQRFTRMLSATVALLLLIGSLTVGLLVLIRTEARREEFAMCLALGARRGQLVTGIIIESLLLTGAGLVASIPLTAALLSTAGTFELPGRISVGLLSSSVNVRLAGVAIAITLGSAVVIGLLASLVGISDNIADMLRARTGATPRLSRRRTRQSLVVAQVAVAVVLLVGTGLFARSLMAALRLNAGFDTSQLLVTEVSARGFGYDAERAERLFADLDQRVRVLPGVNATSTMTWAGGMGGGGTLRIDGQPRQFPSVVNFVRVDSRYFSTIGLRPIRGRDFSSDDHSSSELVGIVSESFGRQLANGGDPVGMTMTEPVNRVGRPAEVVRIVGVVPDVVTDVSILEPLTLYYSLAQRGPSTSRTFVTRTTADPVATGTAIRKIMSELDSRVSLPAIETMSDRIGRQMAPQRFGLSILGALATIALLLTLLGTYTIAETMARAREREMGVRAALGATGSQLGRLIVRETLWLVGLGLALGLGLTWLAAGTVRALLYQVEPLDTASLLSAAVLMLITALAVTARPVLRTARLNIATLLRD
jgi:predicted permease